MLFAKAGIKHPPRTISELTADAKKLTVRDSKGNIKVAGFDPVVGFYENTPERWIQQFGGKWVDSKGHSLIGDRSRLGEVGEVAEEPDRLVRLRQARSLPGRSRSTSSPRHRRSRRASSR